MPKLQVKRSFFGHFLFLGNHHFQQWVGSIIVSLCGSHPTQLPKTQAQTKHGACPYALPLPIVSHPRQTYFPNANASPGIVCYFFFFYSFEYSILWIFLRMGFQSSKAPWKKRKKSRVTFLDYSGGFLSLPSTLQYLFHLRVSYALL